MFSPSPTKLRYDLVVADGGGERRPVGLAEDGVRGLLHELVADLLHRFDLAVLLDERRRQVAVDDAGPLDGVRVLLGEDALDAHRELVGRVRDRLHRAPLDHLVGPRDARLLRGDGEPGDVDQAALLAGGRPQVVRDRATADHGELLGARLGQTGLVFGDRRVVLGELDLAAVDAALLVAPGDERLAGVEHLLVQAGATGVPGVGHGAEADRAVLDALHLGRIGGRRIRRVLRALAAGAVHVAERVAAASAALAVAAGVSRLARGPLGSVVGALTICAPGGDERQGQKQGNDPPCLHASPDSRCAPREERTVV
jgi:hypothetical protein